MAVPRQRASSDLSIRCRQPPNKHDGRAVARTEARRILAANRDKAKPRQQQREHDAPASPSGAASGDPRPSLWERYTSHVVHVALVTGAPGQLEASRRLDLEVQTSRGRTGLRRGVAAISGTA